MLLKQTRRTLEYLCGLSVVITMCDRTVKLNDLIKCNDHHLNASGALV